METSIVLKPCSKGSLCGIFMSCDCGPQIPVFALVETRPRRPSRLPADSICRTEWRHTVLSRPDYRAEQYHAPSNLLRQQRGLHQVSASPPVQLWSIHPKNPLFIWTDGSVGTEACVAIYLRHSGGSITPPSICLYGWGPAGYRLLTLAEGHSMATRCLTTAPVVTSLNGQ